LLIGLLETNLSVPIIYEIYLIFETYQL